MLRLWRATINTRNGLAFAIRSEQAIREELFALALSVPLAWLVGATVMRRVELVAAVAFVLVVELLNTAIEKLADRLTTDHDPQIGRVKDMGSAAVGVALLMAGAVLAVCHRRTHRRDLKQSDCSLLLCKAPSLHDRTATFTITLAQLNPTVGDVAGNAAKARAARDKAKADGADLVVLPELFIAGYPPEDLVLKPAFQAACRAAVEELARETADGGPAMLIGTPWVEDGKLYNACALLDDGRIAALRFKANLPNYGVFDEKRVFARGPAAGPVTVRGIRVGVPICEDIWLEESEEYENVVECLAETGAEILVVPNGSPYARDKNDLRLSIAVARVTESGLPLVYLNQVGGQDELVFDGASFALNADLSVAAQLPAFEESITTLHWTKGADGWRCSGPVVPLVEGDKGDYAACVLGLRDYVRKNGFPGVLLGVSGGIDSALCAAIAVDALGAEQRSRRDAAVPLHRAGLARRCREAREGARHSATRCCRSRMP